MCNQRDELSKQITVKEEVRLGKGKRGGGLLDCKPCDCSLMLSLSSQYAEIVKPASEALGTSTAQTLSHTSTAASYRPQAGEQDEREFCERTGDISPPATEAQSPEDIDINGKKMSIRDRY